MSRLTEDQRSNIRAVFHKTASIRQTAKQTGHSRKAVRRALGCSKFLPQAPDTKPRKSKLDPFKAKIQHLVIEKKLSGVRVLETIKELGYTGGYSILKEHIRIIRPKGTKIPRPPIDHAPGDEGQMDWSPHNVNMGGRQVVVQTGSFVLCYSRYLFTRHFTDQTIESVIKLHEEAFLEINAVPAIITYDNMTTVGRYTDQGTVWINPVFKRFADEYGFKIVILLPGRKERHGKVERPFWYIEDNFLRGREFIDLEDLNSKADSWRANTANVRIHGTTRERPVDRLAREKSLLKPVPWNKSDTVYKEVERLIHVDFCVAIDKVRYSANPELIGRHAKIRLFRDHLEIWCDGKMDCRHAYTDKERNILPEHEEMYRKMTGQANLLKDAFLRLGEVSAQYYEGLKRVKRSAAGYHMSRILKYADRYGADVVTGVLSHAIRFDSFSADVILRIIEWKKFKSVNKKTVHKTLSANTRDFLRTCFVDQDNPERYEHFVDAKTKGGSNE
ncbi:MAG: IS21 family transposase [Thermodesulfobacteriota bacterium]|nr:IS21 family transposase [Thermodesulfobacteriota bacterium]